MSIRSTRKALSPLLLFLGALTASCGGGGGGGGGGGQTPVDPPMTAPDPPYVATLTSAAAGSGNIRVHYALPGAGFEAALFRSTNAATVYASSPTPVTGSSTTISGLANGTIQYMGLGVRPTGGGSYTPSGAVLRARPMAPIYVDAAAAPGGNGSSPGTAFDTITGGLNAAVLAGGGNVWVKDGTYVESSLPFADDVHLYGGFGAAFTLGSRNPAGNTIVRGPAAAILFDVKLVLSSAVIDGMKIQGQNSSSLGVDVDDAEVELRSLEITEFTSFGIRVRGTFTDNELDLVFANCSVTHNGSDGLSLLGAFDLRIHGCNFDANATEGVSLNDLIGLDANTATLLVEGSRFFGNGTDGLDADFAPPLLVGATTGFFDVEIRASRFERNGQVGILLDHDFEAIPGYSADILVRECTVIGNGASGILVDADGPGAVHVHGSLVSANIGDGLRVAGDLARDVATASSSAFTANLGAGVRTVLANRTVALSHCILAGNEAGGVLSAGPDSGTTSSVFYLQPTAAQNTRSWFDVTETNPLAGLFTNAPEEYLRVTSVMGNDLTVSGTPALMPGVPIELNDDGQALTASMVAPPVITASSVPAGFTVPASLTAFANMASVVEDYALPGGSAAIGVGMTSGAAVDAGVLGSPVGLAPGTIEEVARELFYPTSSNPPPATLVGGSQSIQIDFSKNLSAGTFNATTVRAKRTEGGATLGIGINTSGNRLTISAPGGGWGAQDFVIELHDGLQGTGGTPMNAPVAIPYRR